MAFRLRGHGPLIGPFLLWLALGAVFAMGIALEDLSSVFEHNPRDTHTREAMQWLQGKASLDSPPPSLEITAAHGKAYSPSLPTASLFELPWTMVFGKNTPNRLALVLWAFLGAWVLFEIGLRAGWNSLASGMISFCTMGGTGLLTSAVQSTPRAQDQVIGFVLAVTALGFVFRNDGTGRFKPWIGYVLLSLAVGCRPVYLLYFPLLMLIDLRLGRPGQLRAILSDCLRSALPFLIGLALYNWERFDNPLSYGQAFGWPYFDENLTRSLGKIPSMSSNPLGLEFERNGNAFWLTNPVFVFGLAVGLLRPGKHLVRLGWIITFGAAGLFLLLSAPGGQPQFGYDSMLDLLPLAFFGLIIGASKRDLLLLDWLPLTIYSVLINLYGVYWIRTHA